jgi:hypothetical protein
MDRYAQHGINMNAGQATQRANVIREVLIECLRQLLPEAKI